jgi:hypothetical protein
MNEPEELSEEEPEQLTWEGYKEHCAEFNRPSEFVDKKEFKFVTGAQRDKDIAFYESLISQKAQAAVKDTLNRVENRIPIQKICSEQECLMSIGGKACDISCYYRRLWQIRQELGGK